MRVSTRLCLCIIALAIAACRSEPEPIASGNSILIGYFQPQPLMELGQVTIQDQRRARFLFPKTLEVTVLPTGYFYALDVPPGTYVLTSISVNNKISHLPARSYTMSQIPRKERFWTFYVTERGVYSIGAYNLSSFPIFLAQSSANFVSEHPTMDDEDIIDEIIGRLRGTEWQDLLLAEKRRR